MRASSAASAQTITNWVAQAAIDAGKPLPGKDRLTQRRARGTDAFAARECVVLQMERDILAKATAWFAAKGERTSTTSSNS